MCVIVCACMCMCLRACMHVFLFWACEGKCQVLSLQQQGVKVSKGRAYFSALFFFCPFFFGALLFQRRKERKKEARRCVRGESRTPSPKRSAGLQHPKALKEVLHCNTLQL